MKADTLVRRAISDYWGKIGFEPNKIILGYNLLNALRRDILHMDNPVDKLEELRLNVRYEYMGIPIEVDYNNPYALKVGYMADYENDIYEY